MKVIKPQPGPQEAFAASPADVVIFGGAAGGGKSWALLLEPLRHMNNGNFGAVVFRREYPRITNQGGLWDESKKLYSLVGGTSKEATLEWAFPSGAKVKFGHMQYERDKESWHGSQIALLCFDELTEFTEGQFWYMFSRNRSTCGVRPYIRATCNPSADSWVADLISWWIDQETGYPIVERSGVLRWFVREDDTLHWADDPETLKERFPENVPKSLTFILSRLDDNQALLDADPGYRANLLALPLVERERLLRGNWKIRHAAGLIFNESQFDKIVDVLPTECYRAIRSWDLAATEGGGDYTAGALVTQHNGIYYVVDVVRGQWGSLNRNQAIHGTTSIDAPKYADYRVWMEQEPGSGGKSDVESLVRMLAGYAVFYETKKKDKVSNANPFAGQCQAGNVRLLRGEWNRAFIQELVNFPQGKNDDQVDAVAGAFNKLEKPSSRLLTRPLLMLTDEDEQETGEKLPWIMDRLAQHWN